MKEKTIFELTKIGRILQFYNSNCKRWEDIQDIYGYSLSNPILQNIRIKPDFPYRIFKNAEEFINSQEKHGQWIWAGDEAELSVCATNSRVMLHIMEMTEPIQHVTVGYYWLLASYFWKDGTNCGVLLSKDELDMSNFDALRVFTSDLDNVKNISDIYYASEPCFHFDDNNCHYSVIFDREYGIIDFEDNNTIIYSDNIANWEKVLDEITKTVK